MAAPDLEGPPELSYPRHATMSWSPLADASAGAEGASTSQSSSPANAADAERSLVYLR
jgi:hypothetical protein